MFSRLATSLTAAKGIAKSHLHQTKATISPDRAEAPLDPDFRQDHDYARILEATHSNEMEDGAFSCCCGAENPLIHYRGSHPFRSLRCSRCQHIFCSACSATQVLTPLPGFQITVGPVKPSTAAHCGQICSSCGLTHRATRKFNGSISLPSTCLCGAKSSTEWLLFGIGSPDRYKYDPNAAFVQMKVRRAVETVGVVVSPCETPVEMDGRSRMDSLEPVPRVVLAVVRGNDECGLKRRGAVRCRKMG